MTHGRIVMLKQERPSPNCCHKVGSTESSRMSLYAVALRFLFTGTKGPRPNHKKLPQTIISPPPNFTVGTMHSGQTHVHPSHCQMVKRDHSRERVSTAQVSNGGGIYDREVGVFVSLGSFYFNIYHCKHIHH